MLWRLSRVLAASGVAAIFLTSLPSAQAATLTGRFAVVPQDEAAPIELHLRFRSAADALQPEQTVVCVVNELRWSCDTPASRLDVELNVRGYAPRYFWDVDLVEGGRVDLGAIELSPGTRVEGRVLAPKNVRGVRVELEPVTNLVGEDARRQRLRVRSALVKSDGSYVADDVPPGSYSLRAFAHGFSPAVIDRQQIAGEEVLVPDLLLRPLATLEIAFTPPVDFDGQPWQLTLTRALPTTAFRETVRAGAAQIGHYSADELELGSYRLDVLTSRGERVASHDIALQHDLVLPVDIRRIPLEGALLLGGKPAEGEVLLLFPGGGRVTFRTDEAGAFSGLVPEAGRCRARVRLAGARSELHVREVQIDPADGGRATTAIDLPTGAIQGEVVDGFGKPVRASLQLLMQDGFGAAAETDEEGKFRMDGLGAGRHTLRAMAPGFESAPLEVAVTRDEAEVTVVLRRTQTIRGRVLTATRHPVAGAVIRLATESGVRSITTDLEGAFSFESGASGSAVAIIAAGMPRKMEFFPARETAEARIDVVVGSATARLFLTMPPSSRWPLVTRDGLHFFALPELFLPRGGGPPAEFSGTGFRIDLEPGTYWICPEPAISGRCAKRLLSASAETVVGWKGESWE